MNAWMPAILSLAVLYGAACGLYGIRPGAPLWLSWPLPIWNLIAHDWRRPTPNPPRPDYAKIERLERELGLVEPIMPPPVLRTIERDGEVIEIRSWGS